MIHRRYLRYGRYERVRHSTYFLSFLTEQATRLSGSGTSTTITFTNSTNLVNLATHGYTTGQGPFLLSNSGGALPAGLDNVTDYWVNVNDASSFTLHTSEAYALANTSIVGFTDDGTGTNSILVAAEAVDIFLSLKGGKTADQIRALTSIDSL